MHFLLALGVKHLGPWTWKAVFEPWKLCWPCVVPHTGTGCPKALEIRRHRQLGTAKLWMAGLQKGWLPFPAWIIFHHDDASFNYGAERIKDPAVNGRDGSGEAPQLRRAVPWQHPRHTGGQGIQWGEGGNAGDGG